MAIREESLWRVRKRSVMLWSFEEAQIRYAGLFQDDTAGVPGEPLADQRSDADRKNSGKRLRRSAILRDLGLFSSTLVAFEHLRPVGFPVALLQDLRSNLTGGRMS